MANASCKLLICSNKLAASAVSASINNSMGETDLQTRIDGVLTSQQQEAGIDCLNLLLHCYDSINEDILNGVEIE